MKLVCEINKCIGCHSCENICPKTAISMNRNDKGFLKSYIDEAACINCGLCESVCNYSLLNIDEMNKTKYCTTKIYGMKNRIEDIRKKSSSGGIFFLVAKYVIERKGVVYGCVLNENIEAVFTSTDNIDGLTPMMGSKYVTSDIKDSFEKIAEDLSNRRYVLFTGTPCQCWQLRRYLMTKKVKTNSLIVLEFLCHGSPSPVVFNGYKESVEKKYNGKIVDFKFRDKEKVKNPPSSRGMRSRVKIQDGEEIDVYDEKLNDRYFELFKRNYISNDSCYECKFVGFENRTADISLADFWGCEKYYPEFFDKKGISLVLVNSDIGIDIVEKIKMDVEYIDVEKNCCLQAPLITAPVKPNDYEEFWNLFFEKGYWVANKKIVNKYLYQNKYFKFRKNIKNTLKKIGIIK